MQKYVSDIARKPYSIPAPRQNPPYYPPYPFGESTNSIFCNDSSISPEQLSLYHERLERNLPIMVQLQDEKLEPGPTPNKHDGSISLFLSDLANPIVHPYSLCPFPMDSLSIDDVIQAIFDSRVAPDRASWALHYIIAKSGDPSINLTDYLLRIMDAKTDPTYDPDYIAKLSFYCYKKNILDHYNFLISAVTKLPPKSLVIFKQI